MTNLNVAYYRRSRLFWQLVSLLAVLVLVQVYFVNSLVFQAVKRQEALEGLARLQSEVFPLEADYFKRSGQVTLDLAYQMGFKDATFRTVLTVAEEPGPGLGFRPASAPSTQ